MSLANRDDKTPEQAQGDLFGSAVVANTNSSRPVRPERALLRFGVRRDIDDVPLAKPKQLGVWDAEVDRDELARTSSVGEALSDRAVLRILEGSDASGQRRKTFKAEVDEALESYFHAYQAMYGFDLAVTNLFSVLSNAPNYLRDSPPSWVLQLFVDERELLTETYTGHRDDRRVEPAGIDDGEEE